VIPERPLSLRQLQLLLTERCNLACVHCAVPEEESPASGELSTEEWIRFIRTVLDGGVERIVLSGGEALMRADCLEIACDALEHGATQVVIVSNGTSLHARNVPRLVELQLHWPNLHLHVSIDGATPASHDRIRGPGAYERTIATLDRFRAAGGRIDALHTVLHRLNHTEIGELLDLVTEIGSTTWTVFPLAALGRGRDLDDLRLGQLEWEHVLAKIAAIDQPGLTVAVMGPTFGDEWSRVDLVPRTCAEHAGQAVVGPDGQVFTCPPLRGTTVARATSVTDRDGWAQADSGLGELLAEHCPTCSFRPLCTGVDPAVFDTPAGTFRVPSPAASATHIVQVELGRRPLVSPT
jgi:radical SAM protein with 4Fe4S-binding SPASM domain